MPRRLAALPMLLTCLALVFPALAKDASGAEAIVKLDPPGKWHEVHYNRSTTKCASNTATPLCAIETVMRCFILEDRKLCNSVLLSPYKKGTIFIEPFIYKNKFFRYRVVSVKRLAASDITLDEIEKNGPYVGKPGDLEISLDRRQCNSDLKPACPSRPPGEPPHADTVRLIDGHWIVVGWAYPRSFKGSANYRK